MDRFIFTFVNDIQIFIHIGSKKCDTPGTLEICERQEITEVLKKTFLSLYFECLYDLSYCTNMTKNNTYLQQ